MTKTRARRGGPPGPPARARRGGPPAPPAAGEEAPRQLSLGMAVAERLAAAAPAAASAPAPAPVRVPEIAVRPATPSEPEPETPRIYTVSELVRGVRFSLEARFPDVRVEGEVAQFRKQSSGHLYFSLKDESSMLDAVMWQREVARLKFRPEDGMSVLVRGRMTVYPQRGRMQLQVQSIEPTGSGAFALAFEQMKKRLEAEGLFDAARKRPLPFLPRRIGVVTSPQGAVIRDIIHVAHRRFPVPILLAPCAVQGAGAELGIAAALRTVAAVTDVDLVILARGGGSLEDLWAFNEEAVARAVATCPKPVISAVGHETDFTIADFVADVRAPTPSAAAELAVPLLADLRGELDGFARRGAHRVQNTLALARAGLDRARDRLGDPRRLLADRRQMLDDQVRRGEQAVRARLGLRRRDLAAVELALSRAHPRRRIAAQREALGGWQRRLERQGPAGTHKRRRELDALRAKLEALSPLAVLDRGFSLVRDASGKLVTDAAAVARGDRLRVTLRRGELDAQVTAARAGTASDGRGDGQT